MTHELAYGKGTVSFSFPPAVVPEILVPGRVFAPSDPLAVAERAVREPIGTPSLGEMLRKAAPKTIFIVINDSTRPTPYPVLFPPVIRALAEAGIADRQVTLLVATGLHQPHTEAQNRELYGDGIVDRFTIVSHDASDAGSLRDMGQLGSGCEFFVNSLVCEADFLITLGIVTPHYFAGYSGGRKSILPGVAGRETIEKNHARMVELMDNLPPIDVNPVSLDMIEAARRVGVDFILNAVMAPGGEVATVVGGDLVAAWREAVAISAGIHEVPLASGADVCVAGAGGWPRDLNAYQAQKALDHADRAVRPGGTIILAAECADGFGDEAFSRWLQRAWPPAAVMEKIRRNFAMGGHKAYGYAKVAAEKEVFLVSSLAAADTGLLYAKKFPTLQDAVDEAYEKHGPAARWVYLPQGGVTLPVRAEK